MTTTAAVRSTAVLVFTIAALVMGFAPPPAAAEEAEQGLLTALNAIRTAEGRPSLEGDSSVDVIAEAWSGVMAARDELAHNPDLPTQLPGAWERGGENVGYAVKTGATEAELVDRIMAAFLDSSGHRDNMLGDWTHVGVGVVVTDAGKMWVTLDFVRYLPGGAPAADGAPRAPDSDPVATAGVPPQVEEAVAMSRGLFEAPDSAALVVLAGAAVFADALSGAGLAGGDGPVLFTVGPGPEVADPAVTPVTRTEIDRVLPDGGTVYVLGGEDAVSAASERELVAAGYEVRRLAGPSRIETSVRVAEEVLLRRGATGEVLLARADVWADAVSGGAYSAASGSPVVLTASDALSPEVAAFLERVEAPRRVALGGRAALSDAVVRAAGASRVAGADRSATSVAVAEQLWGRTSASAGDTFVTTPGFTDSGWAYALAYAPTSAVASGPQLLVGDDVPAAVEHYLAGLGYGAGVGGEIVAPTPVPDDVVERVTDLVDG